MSSVVSARPASTVILLRERDRAFEILLLKRHDKVAFMGGAYVFPGGRVDDANSNRGAAVSGEKSDVTHFPDLTLQEELTYRQAAAREVHEEANLQIDPASLFAFAHWVTPEIEIRRYDTRFFLARMPHGQVARHDNHETTALAWVGRDGAIAECLADGIMLPPPTWPTCRQQHPISSNHAIYDCATTRSNV